jgi:hypothetical protein
MASIDSIDSDVIGTTHRAIIEHRRPSSRPTAPLPARARSSLAAQMTKPGLASRMEMPPETDRFNDPPGDVASNVPNNDTPLPYSWEPDPNWDTDGSVYNEMTGCLPRPLGCSILRMAEWVNVCPIEDIRFKELYELAKLTPPKERTREMNITFRRIQAQRCIDNPKPDRFGISAGTAGTAGDIVTMLRGWKHNPEGIPLPICGE